MPELLDQIRAEIRERADASRAAVDESERLHAALAALDAGRDQEPTSDTGKATAPRRRARTGASRAVRGANREAVLRVVDERPGVTVAELAASSGVKRTTLYGILRLLIERGEVAKRELPGGQAGYARAEPARPPIPEASPTRLS